MQHEKGTFKHPWTGQELAKHLGISPRQVDRYVLLGLPKLGRNKFDPDSCCQWFRNYELQTKERPKEQGSLVEEDTRLKCAQANLRELELAEKTGKMVETEKVRLLLDRMITAAKTRLMSIPSKLAIQVVACTDINEGRLLLETEIMQALSELSRTKLGEDESASGVVSLDSEALDAPGKTDTQPVGRRKKVHSTRRKPHGARQVANVQG